MKKSFDLQILLLFLFFGGCCLLAGILLGTVAFGGLWYVSQHCISYPFLLLDPHVYVACRMP